MRIRSHRGSFQCRNVSLILFMSDVGLSKQSFIAITQNIAKLQKKPLRDKSPNTEFFLVRIFLYSVQIQENTDHEKLRIWPLFMRCTPGVVVTHPTLSSLQVLKHFRNV